MLHIKYRTTGEYIRFPMNDKLANLMKSVANLMKKERKYTIMDNTTKTHLNILKTIY